LALTARPSNGDGRTARAIVSRLAEEPTMATFTVGKLLRIFVGEKDCWHGQPLYCAIVEVLRRRGIAGATVFRGIEGYGTHQQIHLAKLFSLAPDVPVCIEVVDDEDKINAILPALEEMMQDGLVSLEQVQYAKIAAPKRAHR
jgi:PII-like signaling protein